MSEAIAEAVSQLATKADLAVLKAALAALKADLESKLALLEQRITIRLGGMMV
jgi:hypothetical protein